MGLFAQMIASGVASGDIEIVKPKPTLPKGVQLCVEYQARFENGSAFGFYSKCDVHQVFTDEEIEALRQKYCPKCARLKWTGDTLVPIYKYHDIPAVKILSINLEGVPFPLDYAEFDELNYIYFTDPCPRAFEILSQYTSKNFSIIAKIQSAINAINQNNPVFKERNIYMELVRNIHDYINDDKAICVTDISQEKYLELRTKVLAKHPELNY